MKNIYLLLSLCMIFFCTACTKTEINTTQNTATPNPSTTPSPTPPANCHYEQVQCVKAPCNPVLVCTDPSASPTPTNTATPRPTVTASAKSNSTTNINSNTNINITSNGTNVKITVKNGKRYAEVNGKEVELDANGCYDYDKDGTKIHACTNS